MVKGKNSPDANIGWEEEEDYESLIKYPKIRELITKYASESPKKISSKKFLDLLDLVFIPLTGISTKKLSEIIVPIFQKSGISTGKTTKKQFNQTIQQLIVKSLCSLAKNGYPVESYEKASNGFILTAKIPSDMLTWGGNIIISIEKDTNFSELTIGAKIKGQLYDWGKSKNLIEKFLSDIEKIEIGI